MARFLVTGGAGFIGSHLVDLLLRLKHEVVVFDDLSSGSIRNLSPKAQFILGDVTDLEAIKKAFRDIDACFHLAAIPSIELSHSQRKRTHEVNSTGTVNIFEAAKERLCPVVYASSSAVYGDNPEIPLQETTKPNPLSAYGADKYHNELTAKIAWLIYKIPNVGIRFFNVYGPRQNSLSPYSGVIAIFANLIRQQRPISIFGDGTQKRDFLFVDDAAKILLAAMERLLSLESQGCQVVNACTSIATSINDLANTMEKIMGLRVGRRNLKARPGDIQVSVGDPKLALEHLGLKKYKALAEGLSLILLPDLIRYSIGPRSQSQSTMHNHINQ
jgi:UDP-glucose 4-epimerase